MKKTLISTSLSAIILGGGGAITVSAQDYGENQSVNTNITSSGTTNFKGNNTLTGSITASNGTNTVNFEKGVNTIDATSGKIGITGNNGTVNVNFNEGTTTNTIKGWLYTGYRGTTNVAMKGSESNIVEGYLYGESQNSKLNLTFSGEGENKLIGTKIGSESKLTNQVNGTDSKTAVYARRASLKVDFNNKTANNTIKGDIVADIAQLEVRMGSDDNTQSINTVIGNIVSNQYVDNKYDTKTKITMNMNGGSNIIVGEIIAGGDVSNNSLNNGEIDIAMNGAYNIISGNIGIERSGNNNITVNTTKSDNVIKGNIVNNSDGGTVAYISDKEIAINFKNNEGSNTILANIYSQIGLNTINLGNESQQNVNNLIKGNIDQQNTSINKITLNGNKNTIEGDIRSSWACTGYSCSSNTGNIIKMNGNENLLKGTISSTNTGGSNAMTGLNNIYLNGNKNTIEGDISLLGYSKNTVYLYNQNSNATNIINIIKGNVISNNNGHNGDGTNLIKFWGSTNEITGNVTADGERAIVDIAFVKGGGKIGGDVTALNRGKSLNITFSEGDNEIDGNVKIGGNGGKINVSFADQTGVNIIKGEVYTGWNSPVTVSMQGTTKNEISGGVRGDSANSTLNLTMGNSNGSVHNIIKGKTISVDEKESKVALFANYATINSTFSGETDIYGDVFAFGGTNNININSDRTTIYGKLISKTQNNYTGKTNITLNGNSSLIVKEGAEASRLAITLKSNDNTTKLSGTELSLNARYMYLDSDGNMLTYFDNTNGTQLISGNVTNSNGRVDLVIDGVKTDVDARNFQVTGSGSYYLVFKGSESFIRLGGNNHNIKLSSISGEGKNNTIDIASNGRSIFNLLEIGNKAVTNPPITRADQNSEISGNYSFIVYADPTKENGKLGNDNDTKYGNAYADRIVIEGNSKEKSVQTLSVVIDTNKLDKITYEAGKDTNVAVATVKNSPSSNITFVAKDVINGAEIVGVDLITAQTDEFGKTGSGYTTYFIKDIKTVKVDESVLSAASSALVINYDLYLANFNSINKRMGELRNSNESVGVWGRIFGGSQKTDFGLGSQTEYITTQFGVDKILKIDENANMFLGAAFAYSNSKTNVNQIKRQGNVVGGSEYVGLNNVESDGYELGLYASYVADKGWYNDTIGKVGYIQSDFNFDGSVDASKVKNITMTISNETGYRYDFGKTDDWYIEPQVELGFGYILGSKFTANIKTSLGTSLMEAKHPDIFMLRSKAGATLGKRFVGDKGAATLYFGTFYEYDYVENSENSIILSGRTTASAPSLSSSGRVVLNLGSNIELNEKTRMYIDVEKSFGDKLRTHLQFNLGARYSF